MKELLLKFSVISFILFGLYSPSSTEKLLSDTSRELSQISISNSFRNYSNEFQFTKVELSELSGLFRLNKSSFSDYNGINHYSSFAYNSYNLSNSISEFHDFRLKNNIGSENLKSIEGKHQDELAYQKVLMPKLSSYSFTN